MCVCGEGRGRSEGRSISSLNIIWKGGGGMAQRPYRRDRTDVIKFEMKNWIV